MSHNASTATTAVYLHSDCVNRARQMADGVCGANSTKKGRCLEDDLKPIDTPSYMEGRKRWQRRPQQFARPGIRQGEGCRTPAYIYMAWSGWAHRKIFKTAFRSRRAFQVQSL